MDVWLIANLLAGLWNLYIYIYSEGGVFNLTVGMANLFAAGFIFLLNREAEKLRSKKE